MKPVSGIKFYPAILGICLSFVMSGLMVGHAAADFRVCNATKSLVGVALGYRGAKGWLVEGWWHIEGSSCKTLLTGPLSSRYYYVYAEDAERGGRWDGPVNMCIAGTEFKIIGINDCFARGYQRVGFAEYDTGNQSNWMVQLVAQPSNESEQDRGEVAQPKEQGKEPVKPEDEAVPQN